MTLKWIVWNQLFLRFTVCKQKKKQKKKTVLYAKLNCLK